MGNTAHYEEAQAVAMKNNGFEDLLFQNNVAIVLTGHVHAYERSHPVYQDKLNDKGPTYVVIGDGGNREGHANHFHPQPAWSAFRNGTRYGHGKLTLVNSTHMKWDWIGLDSPGAPTLSEEEASLLADKHVRAGAVAAAGSA